MQDLILHLSDLTLSLDKCLPVALPPLNSAFDLVLPSLDFVPHPLAEVFCLCPVEVDLLLQVFIGLSHS